MGGSGWFERPVKFDGKMSWISRVQRMLTFSHILQIFGNVHRNSTWLRICNLYRSFVFVDVPKNAMLLPSSWTPIHHHARTSLSITPRNAMSSSTFKIALSFLMPPFLNSRTPCLEGSQELGTQWPLEQCEYFWTRPGYGSSNRPGQHEFSMRFLLQTWFSPDSIVSDCSFRMVLEWSKKVSRATGPRQNWTDLYFRVNLHLFQRFYRWRAQGAHLAASWRPWLQCRSQWWLCTPSALVEKRNLLSNVSMYTIRWKVNPHTP